MKRPWYWIFMSDAGRAAWITMQQPENWTHTEYTATHTPSGIQLWVANGPWALKRYSPEVNVFNKWDKKAVWKQYQNMSNISFAGKLLAGRLEK
jgi:hypothetical protein